MQQSNLLGELLGKRRDRAIAIILRAKEVECDRHLPPPASAKLRKVVLDQLNEVTDFALDLLRSYAEAAEAPGHQVAINELFLQRLVEIHEAVVLRGTDAGV